MVATPSGRGYILLGIRRRHLHLRRRALLRLDRRHAPERTACRCRDHANGKGYWFVAADGGVFTFGNAHFYGSTGNQHLAAPVMSMTLVADRHGYWMVAADGGIFAFNVPFEGSMPGVRAAHERTGGPDGAHAGARRRARATTCSASNGAVYAFGTAKFFGSAPGVHAVDLMIAP